MDYADGGDLAKKITQTKTSRSLIKEDLVLDWLTQLCLGLKHIHDRKIIHRDIKAQNIFLMSDDTIRYGDFGVAHVLDYTMAKAKTQVGTPYYIAPEILKGRAYTNKADIWSLGVLFYEMCALDVPIKAASLHDLYKRIMNFKKVPTLPAQYSKTAKELVESMMTLDASKRPSVSDLLAHPALSSRISKFMSEEEQKEEFAHTVLHKDHILRKAPSAGGEAKAAPLARPYSARSGRSDREELKSAAGGAAVNESRSKQIPRPINPPGSVKQSSKKAVGLNPSYERLAGRGSGDKFVAKKPISKNNENRPPAQTPKFGMGARKNSEGALHGFRAMPGLIGGKASPKSNVNSSFADKYGRPSPSQTPRANVGAKKLGSAVPVGFQKQRPASAAYGANKGVNQKPQPFGSNNRKFY